jgi:hypothetical protein
MPGKAALDQASAISTTHRDARADGRLPQVDQIQLGRS